MSRILVVATSEFLALVKGKAFIIGILMLPVLIGISIAFQVFAARRGDIDDHKFAVKLSGRGLNYTVVGRGDGWLDGFGDPTKGIFFDGSYSLNAEPYHSIPDEKTSFQLASPKPPGSRASG